MVVQSDDDRHRQRQRARDGEGGRVGNNYRDERRPERNIVYYRDPGAGGLGDGYAGHGECRGWRHSPAHGDAERRERQSADGTSNHVAIEQHHDRERQRHFERQDAGGRHQGGKSDHAGRAEEAGFRQRHAAAARLQGELEASRRGT